MIHQPPRALFLLDVAIATDERRFLYWLEFLQMGQEYVKRREALPGNNPRMDAFELLWYKTAIAYVEGRRQPGPVGLVAQAARVRASPPADHKPELLDPWIELTMGFVYEGYVIADPARFANRIPLALKRYAEAAKYDSTRVEALVRTAGLQLRSDRASDALATLERIDESQTRDNVVVYWARLLRGKTLDALNRPDESIAAYQRALEIAPSAQAPVVGMMMVESRRGRDDAAEALAVRVRTMRDLVQDPWALYPHGELRLFDRRLAELRTMAR